MHRPPPLLCTALLIITNCAHHTQIKPAITPVPSSSTITHGAPMKQATIHLDPGTTHQTMQGFGASYIDWGRDVRPEYQDSAFYKLVAQDLGLSIVRQQMLDKMEPVNDNANAAQIDWKGFHTDDVGSGWSFSRRMQYMEDFKKVGVTRFMMTPWSPPAFMKTHKAARFGGYLRADMIEEFAEYMAANIILAKKNHDIDIGAISVQNELLFAEPYHSCLYNPFVLRETVRALMTRFKREGITTRILLPEDMMFVDRLLAYIGPTMADPQTREFNGGFCSHRQGGRDVVAQWHEATGHYSRENWMTETSGHKQTWDGALKMASDMCDYIVAGNFNAWIYWQISDSPESGEYAILVNGDPALSPKYHAAKHFYRFVRPGAIRIEGTSDTPDLLPAAFIHPADGTLSIVIINNATDSVAVNLDLGGKDLPVQYDKYLSSETARCTPDGTYAPGTPLIIPPRGIITLSGSSPSLKTREKNEEWPASWNEPAGTHKEKWGVTTGIVKDPPETFTLLHHAILSGNPTEIDRLLQEGANINAPAMDGWTPIHMAAATFSDARDDDTAKSVSRYGIFKRILDKKPDLKARTTEGWTALHAAVINANNGWMQNEQDNTARVADLVRAGIDVNSRDNKKRTPLHWAAWQGYNILDISPLIVDTLIGLGADVNAVDALGRTPLHYACVMGYDPIIAALIHAGARKTIKDKNGKLALELRRATLPNPVMSGTVQRTGTGKLGRELLRASWDGKQPVVEELLAKGADPWFVDSDGFRAVDRARDNGFTKIVQLLLDAEKKPMQAGESRD